MGKEIYEKIKTLKYLFFFLKIKMKLDYLKKAYNFVKSTLTRSMKGNSLDFRVYRSSGEEIVPLHTRDISCSFLNHVPCIHMKILLDENQSQNQ